MRVFPLVFAVAALLGLTAPLASAQQAAPNTSVVNTIDLSYTSGGATISVPSAATATFVVDRKINLAVTGQNAGGTVVADQAADYAVLTYRVQNLGNGTQGFDINVASTGTLGLTYAPTTAGGEGTFWVVVSSSATPPAAGSTPTLYNTTGLVNAGDVPAGGDLYVHIISNIATSAQNAQTRDFTVTATTLNAGTNVATTEVRNQGLTGVDTVFADPGVNGLEAASETLRINAPVLSATKTVAVISENLGGGFNCATGSAQTSPAPVATIPGACVEYTITVTNGTGAGSATNLTITDALPSNVTYAAHAVGGFTTVTRSGSTVTGNITSLAAGATASFTIRATIGTP